MQELLAGGEQAQILGIERDVRPPLPLDDFKLPLVLCAAKRLALNYATSSRIICLRESLCLPLRFSNIFAFHMHRHSAPLASRQIRTCKLWWICRTGPTCSTLA